MKQRWVAVPEGRTAGVRGARSSVTQRVLARVVVEEGLYYKSSHGRPSVSSWIALREVVSKILLLRQRGLSTDIDSTASIYSDLASYGHTQFHNKRLVLIQRTGAEDV